MASLVHHLDHFRHLPPATIRIRLMIGTIPFVEAGVPPPWIGWSKLLGKVRPPCLYLFRVLIFLNFFWPNKGGYMRTICVIEVPRSTR